MPSPSRPPPEPLRRAGLVQKVFSFVILSDPDDFREDVSEQGLGYAMAPEVVGKGGFSGFLRRFRARPGSRIRSHFGSSHDTYTPSTILARWWVLRDLRSIWHPPGD